MKWSEEHDLKIAEKILKATREGRPYSEVWDELSKQFNCLALDCQKRWEEHLESKYKTAVQLAEKFNMMNKMRMKPKFDEEIKEKLKENNSKNGKEKEQKTKKRGRPRKDKSKEMNDGDLNMDKVIEFLRKLGENGSDSRKVIELEKENLELKVKMEKMEKKYKQMEEDYQSVVTILSRAQKMLEVG